MKIRSLPLREPCAAYALMMVLIIVSVSILIMAGALSRTYTESNLNNRNNQYIANMNAAEAAAEKVYANMAFDFQRNGLGLVVSNLTSYQAMLPSTNESSYWTNFEFFNASNNVQGVYVAAVGFLGTNALPSQYTNRVAASNSPIYRIVVNVRCKNGLVTTMTNAIQEDVLLALVPVSTYAIFYNGKLEFTKTATMTVNGSVHANGPIYTGPGGSGATLTFNGDVSSTSFIQPLYNDGYSPPTNKTFFNGNVWSNAAAVNLAINMTNTHSIIEIPTNTSASFANSFDGQQLLYNQANVIILISNSTVTTLLHTPSSGSVPGADPGITITNSFSSISSNLNFLTLTNKFVDQRENSKNVNVAQIDIGKYKSWLTNASFPAAGKFSSAYPTILFVADTRSNTTTNLYAVRITNGIAPPSNNGLGFSVVTPNPLYVWGDYNSPSNNTAGNTNTYAAGTVPAALMSDSLTLLSARWQDSQSSSNFTTRDPTNITVNAAILTGNVASTSTNLNEFSGGVHNLPRLLEDWGDLTGAGIKQTVTLNTSIISLFTSQTATNRFVDPPSGSPWAGYYSAPTRVFSFDSKFYNANQQPPGMPNALVPIRYNWAQPPPKTVTYNVIP